VDSFIGSADFTDREGEILRMAISGLSNKEIAFRLSISEGTVKTHLFNAFRKVGIHTRVELMNAVYARPERGG
jgi:DNA-binding NarL/FixJ family response regulator